MRHFARFVRFLSCLVVVLGLWVPGSALASTGACEERIEWRVNVCMALRDAVVEGSPYEASLPGFCSAVGTSDIAPPPPLPLRDSGVLSCTRESSTGSTFAPAMSTQGKVAAEHPPPCVLPRTAAPRRFGSGRWLTCIVPTAPRSEGFFGRVERPPTI